MPASRHAASAAPAPPEAVFPRAAINRIAYNRMAQVRHVHPNLMRPAGFDLHPHQRCLLKRLQGFIIGYRLAAALLEHRLFFPVHRMPPQQRFDPAALRRRAPHQRQIFLLCLARFELALQLRHRRLRLGHHHHAARILIEPVHNTRALKRQENRVVEKQSMQQRARRISDRRMHHHARRLAQHQHRLVLEQDVQRDLLRDRPRRRALRQRPANLVARPQLMVRLADPAVHRHKAGLDNRLPLRPRNLRHRISQKGIQPNLRLPAIHA